MIPTRTRDALRSVSAASCTDANIASTAAIIRGRAAPAWLTGLGLPARLVDEAGRVRTVGGWPPEGSRSPEAGQPPEDDQSRHALQADKSGGS